MASNNGQFINAQSSSAPKNGKLRDLGFVPDSGDGVGSERIMGTEDHLGFVWDIAINFGAGP